jgi:hypothetical protein
MQESERDTRHTDGQVKFLTLSAAGDRGCDNVLRGLGLSHTSGGGDRWIFSNGGMMISRGKPKTLEIKRVPGLLCHSREFP